LYLWDAPSQLRSLLRGNIRVLTMRSFLLTVTAGLTGGLDSLFVKEVLGADALALGSLSAVWSLIFLVFILFGGWISDNYDRKKMLILGTALTCPNPLIFAFAPEWRAIIIANVLGAVGAAIATPAYVAILFSSSEQKSRSRQIAALDTLNNLANMIVPPAGALLVQMLGGLNEIRKIYLLQFPLSVAVLLYTYLRLEEHPAKCRAEKNLLQASREILGQIVRMYHVSKERKASSWLFLSITGPWAWETAGPFWIIYAAEVCGSPLHILGLLPAVYSLSASLILLPMAEISDRKACVLLLIVGGTFKQHSWIPLLPLVAWILRAFGDSSAPAWTAVSTEIIPKELQSEWEATRDFLWRSMSIPASMVGGLLWNIDPRLPFIFAIAVDGMLRFPALIFRVPETVIGSSAIHPVGPHIILYGLSGSGRTTIARLIQQQLSAEIIDEKTIGLRKESGLLRSEREIYRKIRELGGKSKRLTVIEGEPAIFAAKQKDRGIIVLLVASRDERVRRKSRESKAPEFVAFKELEDEDRRVGRLMRRLYGADISKLPPFDIAINTDRIPPEKIVRIISLLREDKKLRAEET